MSDGEKLVGIDEVCHELGITERRLRRLLYLGHITPAVRRRGVLKFWLSRVRDQLRASTGKLN